MIQLATNQIIPQARYNECGLLMVGIAALEDARTSNLDFILMDIKREGEMTGMEAMDIIIKV